MDYDHKARRFQKVWFFKLLLKNISTNDANRHITGNGEILTEILDTKTGLV